MKLNKVINRESYSPSKPENHPKVPDSPKLLLADLRTKADQFEKLKNQGLIHGDPTEKEMEARLLRTIEELEGIIQKLEG